MYQDRETIETPERVLLEFELAGPASRILAGMLDAALVGGVVILLVLAAVVAGLASDEPLVSGDVGIALMIGVPALLVFVYFPLFEWRWNGQTPGKRAVGIRVARVDARPLDLTACLVRGVLRLVDVQPVPTAAVALVCMVLSRRCLRLGDMAAGTWVLRARAVPAGVAARPEVAWPSAAAAPSLPSAASPEGRLTAREHEVIGRFLARAGGLAGDVRARLAADLARPVLERLGETAADAESFLREEYRRGRGRSLL